METITLNWYAIIVATVAAFVLGFVWFGPLFGKVWLAEAGLKQEDVRHSDMGRVFGYAAAFQFIMAYCLSIFFTFASININGITGALMGFLFGLGWISLSIGVMALFELRSWRYVWIAGGYWTLAFTLMGFIIGVWP